MGLEVVVGASVLVSGLLPTAIWIWSVDLQKNQRTQETYPLQIKTSFLIFPQTDNNVAAAAAATAAEYKIWSVCSSVHLVRTEASDIGHRTPVLL